MNRSTGRLAMRLNAAVLTLGLLFLLCCCGAGQTQTTLTTPQATTAASAAQTTTSLPTVAATASTTRETTTAPTATEPAAFSPDDVAMTATPNSSCFSEVGYSEAQETLVVRFRDSGKRYCYYDVPVSVWKAFRSADSLGRYYNTKIKGYYSCEKG